MNCASDCRVSIKPMPGSGSNTLPTAILAVVLSLVSLSVAVVNVFLSLRNRRLDEADKQEQRQAEISYRYTASAAWGLCRLPAPRVLAGSKCCMLCMAAAGHIR